jgi:radical SAM superfamily enzyme YgiQ (UPF0313 family)
MFGFDNDTKDVFHNTLKFIKKLKIDIADFSILTPFPGTPIFNNLKNDDRMITNEWSKFNMHDVVFKPKNMTPEELKEGVINMYNDYYSIKHTIRRIIYSINLGFFPFFLVLFRNILTTMGTK